MAAPLCDSVRPPTYVCDSAALTGVERQNIYSSGSSLSSRTALMCDLGASR